MSRALNRRQSVAFPRSLSDRAISMIAGLTVVAAVLALIIRWFPPEERASIVILAVTAIALDTCDLILPYGHRTLKLSMSAPLLTVCAIYVSPMAGLIMSVLVACVCGLMDGIGTIKTLLNVLSMSAAAWVAGITFSLLHGGSLHSTAHGIDLFYTMIACILGLLANLVVFIFCSRTVFDINFTAFLKKNRLMILIDAISTPSLATLLLVLVSVEIKAIPIYVVLIQLLVVALDQIRKAELAAERALYSLADLLEAREHETAFHSQRVSSIVGRMLSERPDIELLDGEEILNAARLHDLGKIAISDHTLMKPTALSQAEQEEMRSHVTLGADLIRGFKASPTIVDAVRHHHERWDGKGYPHQLSGEQIPIGARMIAVADAYDAMVSDRPYRRALTHDEALEEIRRAAGHQLDPELVTLFMRTVGRRPIPRIDAS